MAVSLAPDLFPDGPCEPDERCASAMDTGTVHISVRVRDEGELIRIRIVTEVRSPRARRYLIVTLPPLPR